MWWRMHLECNHWSLVGYSTSIAAAIVYALYKHFSSLTTQLKIASFSGFAYSSKLQACI